MRSTLVLLAFALGAGFVCEAAHAAVPPEIEALIKQLSDPDETARLKAAKELGKLKEKAKDAIPALMAATKDADEDVRNVAKRSLAAIKEAVGDKDAEKVNEALAPLIKELRAKDNKNRLAAISKLEEMGADAKPAGAALVEFGMMSPNPKVQEAANAAFEKIDPLVHKEVLTVLIDQSLATRNQAIESLKQLGARAKAAVPAIKFYHNNLCQGLMESGGKLAVRPIRGLHPPMHTLKALVAISPEDADVQKLILGIVGGPDTGMPRELGFTVVPRAEMIAIIHSLKVENKQKYAAFIAGLSASKHDRPLLIQELGKLGPDAKAALPILQALKTDKDTAVRTAAAAAIEAIKE